MSEKSPLLSALCLFLGERSAPACAADGLQILELLLGVRLGLGVVHELVHKRTLARPAREVVARALRKRASGRDDRANLFDIF
jgi:hypothetical protein